MTTLTNTTNQAQAVNKTTMPETQAYEILNKLIDAIKPTTASDGYVDATVGNITDIAKVWGEIMNTYSLAFPAVIAEAPAKKKRKYKFVAGSQQGWPQGVKRDEYNVWKAAKEAEGFTGALNPHIYKAERDAKLAATTDVAENDNKDDNQEQSQARENAPTSNPDDSDKSNKTTEDSNELVGAVTGSGKGSKGVKK